MKTSVSSIHCERPLVTGRVAIGDFTAFTEHWSQVTMRNKKTKHFSIKCINFLGI